MTILKHFTSRLMLLLPLLLFALTANSQKSQQEYYEIKTYRLKNKSQEERVHAFLTYDFLPAAHKFGIKKIGVFVPLETDSTSGKRIVVLIPYTSLEQFAKLSELLASKKEFDPKAKDYIDAEYTNPPYDRMESVLLQAFSKMPKMEAPQLTGARSERVYELRSYEGPTEKIHLNKVHMFNEGDEVSLFKRLGFNAVFYAEVISGQRMPNLMYMTTFDNMVSHDEHWKAFGNDPYWIKLKSLPEYQHNVSKINIYLLRPTDYSDY